MEKSETLIARLRQEVEPIIIHAAVATVLFLLGAFVVRMRIATAPEESARCGAWHSSEAWSAVCLELFVLNSFELFMVFVGAAHAAWLITIRTINSALAEWRSTKGVRGRSRRRRHSWRDIVADPLDAALNGSQVTSTAVLYVLLAVVLLPMTMVLTALLMAVGLVLSVHLDEWVIAAGMAFVGLVVAYAVLFWLRHGDVRRRA